MKRTTASRRGLSKRPLLTKHNVSSSSMDVTYLDDSNDSGIGTEPLHRLSGCRLGSYDHGSSDDRDSSSDSVDSGIFGLSSPESSCMDVGASMLEESGLASLLCQAVSISEDGTESRWDTDMDEPSPKRCCTSPNRCNDDSVQDESSCAPTLDQANSSSSHINLLGIAPQNEPPRLTPGKTGSSSSTPSSTSSSQNHSVRRKQNRKLPSLHVSYPFRSKDGQIELRILAQPEEQHRARYMTEGSRGAVKDRRGTGFPTVKLFGYNRPVTLQVFIGTDQGKIQPHLFYQACKVSGKNCTPCNERVIDGTAVIEICMLPEKDMTVSCDCIGILKERNVDVEQRLPYFSVTRAKKKNTLCRMVFRVNLPVTETNLETLQAASSPILCTQPPGVPEISKKSTKECSVQGGAELFIIGKNFLKDTKVVFQEEVSEDGENAAGPGWQEVVDPEKEFLHQTHLVCRVPPYPNPSVAEAKKVQLTVQSGGKTSEPHTFTYLPVAQGIAVDNLGNFQQISPSLAAAMEARNQLSQSRLMPAIIQVPGVQTANGMSALLVSSQPTTGILTLPRTAPQMSTARSQNVMIRPSLKGQRIASKMSAQRAGESAANSNPIHLVLVQQGEKNMRKNIASTSSVSSSRQKCTGLVGKRPINRFGANRGKHHFLSRLTDNRTRFQNGRPLAAATTATMTSEQHQQHEQSAIDQNAVVFKEEMTSDMDQSPVFSQQNVGNEMEQTSALFASQTVRVSEEASLFVPQRMSSQMIKAEQQQPIYTSANNMISMSLVPESLQVSTELPADILPSTQPHSGDMMPSSVNAQSLPSPSDLFQQQQAQISQMQQAQMQLQNQISQANLLDMPMTESLAQDMVQAQIQQEQQRCQQQQAELLQETNSIHQALNPREMPGSNCQTLVVKQLADEGLCSPLASTDLVQSHLLAPALQPTDLLSPTTFDRPPLELPLPQESLSPGRESSLMHNASIMQDRLLMRSPESSVPTSLPMIIKPEILIEATSPSAATPLTSQLNICISNSSPESAVPSSYGNQMPESQRSLCLQRCSPGKDVCLQNGTSDFPRQHEQVMIDRIKASLSEPEHEQALMVVSSQPSLSLPPLTQPLMVPATTSTSLLHQEQVSVNTSTTTLSLSQQPSVVSTPNPLLCHQVVNSLPTHTLNVTIMSQTAPPTTSQTQPQDGTVPTTTTGASLSSFQTSMTNALSQLSEADLLSFINPSTFDSIY